MAYAPGVTGWILSKSSSLDFQVEHLAWISRFFPELSEVAASISLNGRQYIGWGSGSSKDHALVKSIAEATERIVMQDHKFPTSNGLAAHVTAEAAGEAAKRELIERDYFLCHFFSKVPFVRTIDNLTVVRALLDWIEENGVAVSFFKLGESGRICLMDGRQTSKKFGFIMGSAIKETLDETLFSATIEAGRKAYKILNSPDFPDSISAERFSEIKHPGFSDHGRLSLNVKYANQISFLFEDKSSRVTKETPSSKIDVKLYRPLDPRVLDCPLYYARATSGDAQELFLGQTKIDKINLKRISEFYGNTFSEKDLNLLPHPFD